MVRMVGCISPTVGCPMAHGPFPAFAKLPDESAHGSALVWMPCAWARRPRKRGGCGKSRLSIILATRAFQDPNVKIAGVYRLL